MLRTIISVFITLLLISFGCTRTPARYAAALADADSLAECGRPDSARTLLAAIPADSLSRADKALLYLLWVKTSDKAFLTHTSADTIRMALDYFGSHGPKLRRAEARYYEARVLTDLKDYAPALDAFDEALALLGHDTTRAALHLKSLILSQNAQLLEDLRLYDEAIPYFNSAIETSIFIGDSLEAALDLKDVAFCLVQIDSIMMAEEAIARAMSFSTILPKSINAEIEVYRRYIFLYQGNASHAVMDIDSLLANIPLEFRNFPLMVATKGYHELGLRDSSNHYALLLLDHPSSENKSIAYQILAMNAIEDGDNDIAHSMLKNYKQATANLIRESSGSSHTLTSTISRAQRSETQVMHLKRQNIILSCALMGVVVLFLIIGIIRTRIRLRIMSDLADVMQLQQHVVLSIADNRHEEPANSSQLLLPVSVKSFSHISNSDLRRELIERVKKLKDTPSRVEPELSASELCERLRGMVKSNSCLPDSSPLWEDIRNIILSVSPQFCNNLLLLVGEYNDMQFKISMLIRMGFKPKEISILLARGLNDLTYHRKNICNKAFGSEISLSELANAILKL